MRTDLMAKIQKADNVSTKCRPPLVYQLLTKISLKYYKKTEDFTMRTDSEMVETYIQMYLGMFAILLLTPCAKLMGGTGEQIKMLFAVTIFLYMLLPIVFFGIERRLSEKIGSLLRYFLFVFTVITILICLLFLIVVMVLRFASFILS
jgi:hypothetical protein